MSASELMTLSKEQWMLVASAVQSMRGRAGLKPETYRTIDSLAAQLASACPLCGGEHRVDKCETLIAKSVDDERVYYILAASERAPQDVALWWRPDGNGYTYDIKQAGLYTEEYVSKLHRSGDVPVHRDVARRYTMTIVRRSHLHEKGDVPTKRVPDGTPGVRDIDAPCEDFNPSATKLTVWSGHCDGDGHYLCRSCEHWSGIEQDAEDESEEDE